jgi:hypothetical protein
MKMAQENKLQDKVDQVIDWKTGQIARMNTILASMSTKTLSEKEKMAGLANLGWASSNPLLQESFAADEARIELLEHIPPSKHKVIIKNLPQSVDRMLVSFTLEEMGFIVSAQQSQERYEKSEEEVDNALTETTDESADIAEEIESDDAKNKNKAASTVKKSRMKKAEKEVNVLYFGHLVRNNDIKLVLYTMLRAGIQLRHVKVFLNQSNENARQIEFGYSKSYEKRAPYSVDKIKKAKRFKR